MIDPTSRRRAQRGSTLLMVMVALVALLIIGLAAVEFTGRDAGSARISSRKSAVERCAMAARNWIMTQGATKELPGGTTLVIDLAGAGGEDSVTLTSGEHYDGTIDSKPKYPSMGGLIKRGHGNETNGLPQGSIGSPTVYPAICKDTDNRQYEVEVAFGVNL